MPIKHLMVPLSDQSIKLILGSLLGNGSLKKHPGYVNARFSFRHLVKQRNYFNWKVAQLGEISGDKSVWLQPPDGFSVKNAKLRYQSLALPSLTELYYLTHSAKKLEIKRKWLNLMNELSLAIWWMDDGSLVRNCRQGVFCTDGFDEQSVKRLARYLQVVWSISTSVGPVTRTYNDRTTKVFRIWIRSTNELKKLLRLIAPHIPEKDMLYKVLILYKDTELQQRWISELAELTKFTELEINSIVNERKTQLKFYSEKDIVHPLM